MRDSVWLAAVVAAAIAVSIAGCGGGTPPAASIEAKQATPEMKAAATWLTGAWEGSVEIDRDAVRRTRGISDEHVASIEAARMQFVFQKDGKVAISASVPTATGPAARNALATWTVINAKGPAVAMRIDYDDQPSEAVRIQRVSDEQFTMTAPQSLGVVRFDRVR